MRYDRDKLAELRHAIAAVDTPERREAYRQGRFPRSAVCKDRGMRYRWDCLWCVPDHYARFMKWAYDAGLNDSHIDTALRAIVPVL